MFGQRKNKKFHYAPRFQKDAAENEMQNFESQWKAMKSTSKRKQNLLTSLPFLVLFLITVLIVFYLLTQYETT